MDDLEALKKDVFFRLIEAAGRVFILVRYSDGVRIGGRGFLPDEMENGIVLVFNRQMNFTWDTAGIHATLAFGSSVEKCFIPPEDIVAVYSPELGAQFVVSTPEGKAGKKAEMEKGTEVKGEKVIKVDFTRKK